MNQRRYFSLYVGKAINGNSVKGEPLFLSVEIKKNSNILWKVTLNDARTKVIYKQISDNKAGELLDKFLGDPTTRKDVDYRGL